MFDMACESQRKTSAPSYSFGSVTGSTCPSTLRGVGWMLSTIDLFISMEFWLRRIAWADI